MTLVGEIWAGLAVLLVAPLAGLTLGVMVREKQAAVFAEVQQAQGSHPALTSSRQMRPPPW